MIYKILKNIFITSSFLLYLTTFSLSEISSKKWSAECSEDEKTCLAVIISEVKNNDDAMQTIATAIVQIGSAKQKKTNLVDEDDQTYKLSEENKKISVLTVKLPLNADLRKKPAVVIDDKNLGSLNFTHCNSQDGCVSNVVVDDEVIDLFKKGKTMTVLIGIYRSSKNMKIEFPLKNFTKSYAKLIKE